MKKKNTTEYQPPVIYVEPNYVGGTVYNKEGGINSVKDLRMIPLEDYCIYVDLKVEIKGKPVTSNKTSQDKTFIIQWNSSKDKSTVSFFSGTRSVYQTKNGQGALTTNYTNTYLDDITGGKGTSECLGISSIDIQYNSYFVPQVTIKFVDIRGVSLFAPAEMNHKNYYNHIGGFSDEDIASSFFNCFFAFPYPKFTMLVKGFYGQPALYTLNVSDFRARFDCTTGNFEATVSFVGFTYSFLNDISLNCLLAAPYSDAGGEDYWDERKGDDDFYLVGINNEHNEMVTMAEVLESLAKADQKVQELLADNPAIAKQEELKGKVAAIDKIGESTNKLADAISDSNNQIWKDDYVVALDNDKKTAVILSKSDSVGSTLSTSYAEAESIQTAYTGLTDTLTKAGSKETVPALKDQKATTLFKYNSSTKKYEATSAVKGNKAVEEAANKILTKINADPSKYNGSNFTNGYIYKFGEINGSDKDKKKLEEEIEANEKEVQEAEKRAMAQILGFIPNAYNFCKMIMAHVECYIKLILDTAISIYNDKGGRTVSALGMGEVVSDMSTTEKKEDFVPPFPQVALKQHLSRNANFGTGEEEEEETKSEKESKDNTAKSKKKADKKDSKGVTEFGDDTTSVAEEAWIGDISENFAEEDFINGILNGAKTVGAIIMMYQNANSGDTEDMTGLSQRSSAVKYPIVPMDMARSDNPWGSGEFSSDGDFAGKVLLRMYNVFAVPDPKFQDAGLIGKADAQNFAQLNSAPHGAILDQIKGGTMTFDNYFLPIVQNNSSVSRYMKDGRWPWSPQTGENTALLSSSNSLKILTTENDNVVVPVGSNSFKRIVQDLNVTENGCTAPRNHSNYLMQTSGLKLFETVRSLSENSVCYIDHYWNDYNRFLEQLKDEYSGIQGNFENCSYNGETYSSEWLKGHFGSDNVLTDVNFSDLTTIKDWKLITFPGLTPSGNPSKDVSILGQPFLYKQKNIYAKAYLFLKSMLYFSTEGAYDSFISTVSETQRFFVCGPRFLGNNLGADIWYNHGGKNKFEEVDGFTVPSPRYTNGSVRDDDTKPATPKYNSLRKEVEDRFKKEFMSWAASDFRKILTQFGLKFKNLDEALEIGESELLLDSTSLGKYVNLDAFNKVYVEIGGFATGANNSTTNAAATTTTATTGDTATTATNTSNDATTTTETPQSEKKVKYNTACKGFQLEFGSSVDTSLIKKSPIVPSMYIFPTEMHKVIDTRMMSSIDTKLSKSKMEGYWNAFITQLKVEYTNGTSDSTNSNAVVKDAKDDDTPIDLKVALYHYCKIFYDKWIAGEDEETYFNKTWKLDNFFPVDDQKHGKFHFIDSFYNYVGDRIIINPQILVEDILKCTATVGITLLSVLGDLLSKNRFQFICMENFTDLSDPLKMQHLFDPIPFLEMELPEENRADFVCLYTYEQSTQLEGGDSSAYPSDSFMLNHDKMYPFAVSHKNMNTDYSLPAFGVAYGMQYQSYFSNVDVSMDKPMVTEESLKVQYKLCGAQTDTMRARQYVTYGQDLFTIYSNNSYTCKVTMMGDAWVQPLMYFCLTNVPMFRGSYLIEKTSHHIEPGIMTTEFTGVRMANTSTKIGETWIKKAYVDVNEDWYAASHQGGGSGFTDGGVAGGDLSSSGAGGDRWLTKYHSNCRTLKGLGPIKLDIYRGGDNEGSTENGLVEDHLVDRELSLNGKHDFKKYPNVECFGYDYSSGKVTHEQELQMFEKCMTWIGQRHGVWIHCARGVDRTGKFCFLLEGVIGCSKQECTDDFCLSALKKKMGNTGDSMTNAQHTAERYSKRYGNNADDRQQFQQNCINYAVTKIGVNRTTINNCIQGATR